MNRFAIGLRSVLMFSTAALAKEVEVKGYTKKDGTVVKGILARKQAAVRIPQPHKETGDKEVFWQVTDELR